MFNSTKKTVCGLAVVLLAGLSTSSHAASINVAIGDDPNFVTLGDGFTPNNNNGLVADAGNMWGISNNSSNRIGLYHAPYSSVVDGSALPSTIQQGTYTLTARVGNNGNGGGGFAGLNNGNNALKGLVAGFFSTIEDTGGSASQDRNDAQSTKNNMFIEFNDVAGVTYTAPAEADPNNDVFTTWTFTWDVGAASAVIGTNPSLGFYVKTGNSGGNGFWDDSELSFTAIPEPSSIALVAMMLGSCVMGQRVCARGK